MVFTILHVSDNLSVAKQTVLKHKSKMTTN